MEGGPARWRKVSDAVAGFLRADGKLAPIYANTRLFFDLVDRRYNKEGSFNTVFTSNKNPARWRDIFNEDDALLCALDRIFDDAEVFKIRGESFRGKQLVTMSFQTSRVKEFNPTEAEVK